MDKDIKIASASRLLPSTGYFKKPFSLATRILTNREQATRHIEWAGGFKLFSQGVPPIIKLKANEYMDIFQNELIAAIMHEDSLSKSECLEAVKAFYENPGPYDIRPTYPEALRFILAKEENHIYEDSLRWLNEYYPSLLINNKF